MLVVRFVIFSILLCAAIDSHAEMSMFLSMGYGRGGTRLATLTGGQDYNIQAGSGLFVSGGVIIPVTLTKPHRFESQFGVGYMFQDDASHEENRVSLSRVPFEAIYFYRNRQELFRLGWGLTYQAAGKITAKGTNYSAETRVDNAVGWILAAEKLWTSQDSPSPWGLGVRYMKINYHLSKFSKDANGDTLYFTLSTYSP